MKTTTTLIDHILQFPHRPTSSTAVKYKKNSDWVELNWTQYFSQIEALSLALQSLTQNQKTHVAIWSNTRFEWSLVDCATLAAGWTVIPVYQNSTPDEVLHILNHSEAEILILENQQQLSVFDKVRSQIPKVKHVFVIDKIGTHPSLEDLVVAGNAEKKNHANKFAEVAKKVRLDDPATIIYTSGTTGLPKGVLLTHRQIASEIGEAFPYCGANSKDVALSFLPYAHVMGRIEHWGSLWIGYTLVFAESIESLRKNLKEIQPTIMVAVPRIFEKIYSSLISQMENQPLKAKLFRWALSAGQKVSHSQLTKSQVSWLELGQYLLADKLVLKKVKQAFGGRLRFCISGGAPIQSEIARFFHSCGVLILEGYGLTETTAAICVNTPFQYRFGSVGKPIGDVELKLAYDGEILVKSDKVMKEYYKNPEATLESLKDGWFHTGDIGEILPSGDLRITDRKKDLIKTAGGKYIAPQKLEGLLKMNSIISQVLIHGDQKKFVVALLTLDQLILEKIAQEKKWSYNHWQDLVSQVEVESLVRRAVADANAQLASFEMIKKFKILHEEFTVENGSLTPSMKIKRKYLDTKFKLIIESLYND
jgi:long-chain acyl-CoA synthetase